MIVTHPDIAAVSILPSKTNSEKYNNTTGAGASVSQTGNGHRFYLPYPRPAGWLGALRHTRYNLGRLATLFSLCPSIDVPSAIWCCRSLCHPRYSSRGRSGPAVDHWAVDKMGCNGQWVTGPVLWDLYVSGIRYPAAPGLFGLCCQRRRLFARYHPLVSLEYRCSPAVTIHHQRTRYHQ